MKSNLDHCFSLEFRCTYSSVNLFDVCSAAPIGSITDVLPPEEILKTIRSKDALKLASRNQNPNFRNEGPSSDSPIAATDGKNIGRKKNFMKFLCFMSF